MSFFPKVKSYARKGGMSLVEIIIGTALIVSALIGLFGAFSFYLRAGFRNTDALQAVFLAEEGVEAMTLLRDESWSNLSTLTTGTWYGLQWNGAKWVATTTVLLIDGVFSRTFLLDGVYRRDFDKDIIASTSPGAKTLDPNIKRVTVRVSRDGLNQQLITYLANLFE